MTSEEFIDNLDVSQREIAEYLHQLMMSYPDVSTKLSYKIPFYYRKSWVTFIAPTKDGSIDFSFIRGNELSNDQDILEARGRKQVRSVNIKSLQDFPESKIIEIINEALLLDEQVPYKLPRLKNKNKIK